jgi:hypothetical protein
MNNEGLLPYLRHQWIFFPLSLSAPLAPLFHLHRSLFHPSSYLSISPAIMAHPLKTVPAFYEPVALPVVPRLLSQTDILLHSDLVQRMLKISLDPSSGAVRSRYASRRHYSSQPYKNAVAFRALSRSPSPRGRPTPAPSPITRSAQSSKATQMISDARLSDDDENADGADNSDASASTSPPHRHSIRPNIQKPQGKVGRPGSGGYKMEDELTLHARSFKELKVKPYCPSLTCT